MKRRGGEGGAASAMVMAALAALGALFAAAVAFVEAGTGELGRARGRDAEEARLTALASAAVARLLADPTPESDSPLDPVWSGAAAAGAPEGYGVGFEDLSSRVGLNWVRKELLAELGALKPGATAEELQQHREDRGLQLDVAAYGAFVEARDLEALFTAYGWFNVNVSDEFALRWAALARTGDPAAAEDLRARVQQARMRRRPEDPLRLVGRDEIAAFVGPAYRQLRPVVGAEPAMNVHFVPERVVEALVRHYGADRKVGERILAERAVREISPAGLEQMLGEAATKTPLAHYLGVRTWFWRITVTGPSLRLAWVLARMPDEARAALRVVEERWDPR